MSDFVAKAGLAPRQGMYLVLQGGPGFAELP